MILENWSLIQGDDFKGHLKGVLAGTQTAIITSAIRDIEDDCIITASGHRYTLGTPHPDYEKAFKGAKTRLILSMMERKSAKQERFIKSLPKSDRRRQLYESPKDSWQMYLPRVGWVEGGPCDAVSGLFKLGVVVRLGDGLSNPGLQEIAGAKQNMLDFEPNQKVRDSF